MKGIVLPDGSPLSEDNLRPVMFGYHIVHKHTGRILPGTTRNEIYSKAAAIRKMNWISAQFNMMAELLDIWEYELKEIYEYEKPRNFIYIVDEDDWLFM